MNAVDNPARQTFVTDLVASSDMSNAVALNSASFNTARLIGPAVAGILIVLVGSGWVFMINAATFIAVLAALAMLRGRKLKRMPRAPASAAPSSPASATSGVGPTSSSSSSSCSSSARSA